MANKNPSPATRFKPGQSGNTKGRPPGTFSDALRAALEEPCGGKTTREVLVARAVTMAVAGNLDALKWVVERTDGKVRDQVEHHGGDAFRLRVEYVNEAIGE